MRDCCEICGEPLRPDWTYANGWTGKVERLCLDCAPGGYDNWDEPLELVGTALLSLQKGQPLLIRGRSK